MGNPIPMPRPSDVPRQAVRVLSCPEPGEFTIRTLSRELLGLFTHWGAKRPWYCDPDGCAANIHKWPRTWRGYLAAEVWEQARRVWVPCCFEITENCERDMRQLYKRGQVWKISREASKKGKHFPVVAELLEQRPESDFPHAFDLQPILTNLYHHCGILVNQPNPMPCRLYLACSEGEAPPNVNGEQEAKPFDKEESRKAFEELRRARAEQTKMPART